MQIVPLKEELYSRNCGILEADHLAEKNVIVLGVGTLGSQIIDGLVKAGLGNTSLVDNDRYEIGNIFRHIIGGPHAGRKKVKAVSDHIHEVNPYAKVCQCDLKIDWDCYSRVEEIIRGSDLVICATVDKESSKIINKICVEQGIVCIYPGVFRRAYGGRSSLLGQAKLPVTNVIWESCQKCLKTVRFQVIRIR